MKYFGGTKDLSNDNRQCGGNFEQQRYSTIFHSQKKFSKKRKKMESKQSRNIRTQ